MKQLFSLGLLLAVSALTPALAQQLTNTGATITLTGGVTLSISGSLSNTSGTLDISSGSNQVYVGGNLVNAAGATLVSGTASTVTLNGTTAQQLELNGAALNNLTVNNTGGGVSLPASSNADVAGTLTLTSGMVTTNAASTLRLLNGAVLTGEQSDRYVKGNLAAVKTTVPAGTATTFPNSLTLTPTVSSSNLTVTRRAGFRVAQVSYGTNSSGTNQGIDRIWQTSSPVGGTVQLNWLADNDNGLSNFTQSQAWARTAAPVAGSDWTRISASQDAASTRTVTGTAPSGTSFSFFTSSITAAPLPVTLVSFTAERQGADGVLRWATASELHNASFQVESSTDGLTFQRLGQVAGAGTSSQAHTYQFTDAYLARYAAAQVYYRLRQVDQDGTSTYSPVRTVQVPLETGLLVQAYPNPSASGQAVLVSLRTRNAGTATVLLTDVLGRFVSQQQVALPAGVTTWPVAESSQLATGVYLLRVQQGDQQQSLKLVRQ